MNFHIFFSTGIYHSLVSYAKIIISLYLREKWGKKDRNQFWLRSFFILRKSLYLTITFLPLMINTPFVALLTR